MINNAKPNLEKVKSKTRNDHPRKKSSIVSQERRHLNTEYFEITDENANGINKKVSCSANQLGS
jgi:hypothetical protein